MSGPRHLYSERVEIWALSGPRISATGVRSLTRAKITDVPDDVLGVAGEMMCRISPGVISPYRSTKPPKKAGMTQQDREALLMFDITDHVHAGDHVHVISGAVRSVWEIRTRPEVVTSIAGNFMHATVVEMAAPSSMGTDSLTEYSPSAMRHLYESVLEVYRDGVLLTTVVDAVLGTPGQLQCRLAMGYVRPGRDLPLEITAGRSADRDGLLFCDYTTNLQAGDHIKAISGPHAGVFELRTRPDGAKGYGTVHHLEVPYIEVAGVL